VADTSIEEIEFSGVPLLGDSYPTDFSLTAKTIETSLEGDDSELSWTVTVQYDREAEVQDEDDDEKTPLEEPATVSFGSNDRDVIIENDAAGDAIETSAGEPIRGITNEQADFAITVQKNLASIDLDLISQMMKKVNNAVFYGATIGTTRLSRVSGNYLFHQDIGRYFSMTYEFQVRDGGWDKSVVDEGFLEISAVDGSQIAITVPDVDGNLVPVAEPHLLDGAGVKLAVGDAVQFIEVITKTSGDFSSLGIPVSFDDVG